METQTQESSLMFNRNKTDREATKTMSKSKMTQKSPSKGNNMDTDT